jgi:hypothetical protein
MKSLQALRMAEKHFLNGIGGNTNRREPPRKPTDGQEADDVVIHSPTDSEAEDEKDVVGLEVDKGKDDEEDVEEALPTDAEVEWQREFELLKATYAKPKVIEKAIVKAVAKRKNILRFKVIFIYCLFSSTC